MPTTTMSPSTPLTTVTAFNNHLTALLETLADLDRDITNLSNTQSNHPTLLTSSPPSPPSPSTPSTSSSPPSTPKSIRKIKALHSTARGIATRLAAFEKDLQAAEKRTGELREKYHRADETDGAMKRVFAEVFEGVALCGRGFAELKGWWVGVVREGTGAGVWAGVPL